MRDGRPGVKRRRLGSAFDADEEGGGEGDTDSDIPELPALPEVDADTDTDRPGQAELEEGEDVNLPLSMAVLTRVRRVTLPAGVWCQVPAAQTSSGSLSASPPRRAQQVQGPSRCLGVVGCQLGVCW